jgi:hypothetical protein
MFELLEAEGGVAETNGLIERQRLLIEQLGYEGYDTTSARTVFDSLLISLALYLQERHRLRAARTRIPQYARPAAVSRHHGGALKRLEHA